MFPEIRFSDSFILPTYILTISLIYTGLLFYVVSRAKKKDLPVSIALDLALVLMVGGFIGGRTLHVFYELPAYYAEDWTRAFRFWEGGFVFFGGFFVAFLSCLAFIKKKKLSFYLWADFYAPVIALGYALGRVSCFLAGCCYGRFCSAPWAVVFPWDYHQTPRHPVQLYVVFWELAVFALLIYLEKKKKAVLPVGMIFLTWLLFHSLGRLMMEYFRDDFRGQFIFGLSISTWISLFLLATAAGLLSVRLKSKSQ